jgi:Ca2+-transporting ATPase
MTVVQVLVVNVLTDGLPAVALTRDAPSPFTMQRPPDRSSRLFPPRAWAALVGIGVLVGAAALGAYLLGRGDGHGEATTMAFATVALSELALVYAVRSPLRAAVEARRNRHLDGAVLLSAGLVAACVYLPPLHDPLGTVSLHGGELGIAAGLALAPFAAVELAKALLRRTGRTIDPEHPE